MVSELAVLEARKAEAVAEAEEILTRVTARGDGFTDDEEAEYNTKLAGVQRLSRTISAQAALREEQRTMPATVLREMEEPAEAPRQSDQSKAGNGSGGFKHLGEWAMAVRHAALTGERDPRLFAIAGASETVDEDGGFLVPTDFSREIIRNVWETGQILSRIRGPINVSGNGLVIPAVDETSRANGSRFGGVRAYWLPEGGTKTATQPQFRQIELKLKKLAALSYATDELLQDAGAYGQMLPGMFADEIRFAVEDAVVEGTGVGQPLGILNSDALVSVSAESGQAVDTIVYENVLNMWSRLPVQSYPNAVWLVNQNALPSMAAMSLTVGVGGVPVWMPATGAAGSPFSTLFGRPVIPVEYASSLGDVGDIILADLSQYIGIDKGGIQQDSSIHVRFTTDETAFRAVYRFDGAPLWNSAITPFKGSTTISPFIALAAR